VPKQRIPLVGVPNQRNYDSLATLIAGKDQRFRAGIIGLIQNPMSNTTRAYFEKRPGFETLLTPSSGNKAQFLHFSRAQDKFVSAFMVSSSPTLYVGTTLCGTTT
jgi:hypothetical protein